MLNLIRHTLTAIINNISFCFQLFFIPSFEIFSEIHTISKCQENEEVLNELLASYSLTSEWISLSLPREHWFSPLKFFISQFHQCLCLEQINH